MKTRNLLLVFVLIFAAQTAFSGISLNEPDGVGGNFVATNQDKSSMSFAPDGTGAGPGVDFFLKYNINPKTFLTMGTGIQTITDKMMKWESFMTTLLPAFEVKVGFKPNPSANLSPILFAGISAFGSQSKVKMPGSNQVITGDRYYDAALLLGGGFEYALNEKVAFQATGDYRYIATSDLDKKPQLWVAKAGLSYKLKESPDNIYREEIEYPVGDSEIASLDDLFKESNLGGRDEEADALALLFQPEEAVAGSFEESANATEYSSSSESNLFLDDLNQSGDPIRSLESRVSATESAISQLNSRLAGGYTSNTSASPVDDAAFKTQYQASLDKFYSKDYNTAIQMFQNLLQSNPTHKLASNCQYWIGESYNAMGRYSDAIESFNKVMDYRSSYKFDDALIMNGVVYMKLGNNAAAREQFQQLVSKYPTSEYAPKAMRYLGRL